MKLIFGNLFTTQIIVSVPLFVELVLDEADVVAEAKRSIVVDNSMQIIQRLDLQRVLEELRITAVLFRIEVPDWEID